MIAGGKRITTKNITVSDFLSRNGESLGLKPHQPLVGLDRLIEEPALNRPGLALSGFFSYFAKKRVQVFGNSEHSYLTQLTPDQRIERFSHLCDQGFPCLIVARGLELEASLLQIAQEKQISVFSCELPTMTLLNSATIKLENEFAPRTSLHGCMVDYRGIGVLILGQSGSGKSETAIGLLEKGAALVADDMVLLRQIGDRLSASAKDFAQGYLEMRGIGILNVANLYGLSAIRPEKQLDLVVDLKPANDLNKVDRIGISQKSFQILDLDIPLVEIPVAPGRDTARLIGVAALNLQLQKLGFDMADEFNQKLQAKMAQESNHHHL